MAPANSYDERLERLLTTSAGVFARQGYHPTAMRDLSRATGMSLAGIYHYVSGKEELLFLILERCFSRVLDGARRAIDSTPNLPAEGQIAAVIHHHVMFFTRHMDEMKVLSHEADSLSDERLDRIKSLKRTYVELLEHLIMDVENLPDGVNPKVAAFGLFGMMNWIYKWYDPSGPVDPDELAHQFSRLFFTGLSAPAYQPISQ